MNCLPGLYLLKQEKLTVYDMELRQGKAYNHYEL